MRYDDLTRDQLINLLVKRDARRKLGLVWEREEVEHEAALNGDFVTVGLNPGASHGEAPWRNLIIEGNNFDALRWLRMTHANRVKAIYIDPPYNTGKKDFTYNDTFVSREDRFRHSKWIETAYQRLLLARDLLRENGVIFVSIGDDEINHVGLLLDDVFGANNRVGTIVWKNATDNNPTRIAAEHEYILCYAADADALPSEWKVKTNKVRDRLLAKAEELRAQHPDSLAVRIRAWKAWFRENKPYLWPFQEYDDLDEVGPYTGSRSVHNPGKEGYRYDVLHDATGKPCKQPLNGYRFPKDTMDELVRNGRIIFGRDHTKIVELKVYARDYRTKLPSVIDLDGRRGANELKELFPDAVKVFSNPKPTDLIAELLAFVTSGDDIVLDFYAGSGSTGHAVAKLNADDGGRRRFILVNEDIASPDAPDRNVCLDICAERVRRALPRIAGHGTGGFAYLKAERITYEDIAYDLGAEQVWLTIQAMHGLPLSPLGPGDLHVGVAPDGVAIVYCDRFKEGTGEALRAAVGRRFAFVYAWTPGPVREALGADSGVEVRAVPDELVRRFRP